MAFVRADEYQFGFLLLFSSSVLQLGFGYGRTIFKFPNIAKPCSLCVILETDTTKKMERPPLDKYISLIDFNDFYWLKEELLEFCRENDIKASGGKIELTKRIQNFLLTGDKTTHAKLTQKPKSNFDWNTEKLDNSTLITDNYKNTENVRAFFIKEIGTNFSFNVKFMNWLKENAGKT